MSAFPADDVMKRYLACPIVGQLQINSLLAHGVPPTAIANPDVLVRAMVAFSGCRFDFPDEVRQNRETEPALLALVRDEIDGCPLDLAAWAPNSGKLAMWRGRLSYIGEACGPRLHEHGALPVYADPLSWLASDRNGIVIVDQMHARHELIGPFAAMGGLGHARSILHSLSITPRIFVAQAQQSDAA
jgi:hypothetical protein